MLDLHAQAYQTVQGIQRSSVDYYASLHRQLRAEQIRNGARPNLPICRISDKNLPILSLIISP